MKQTNPNLGKISRSSFLPHTLQETTPLKNDTFIWIRIHISNLVYTTSLSDLCFNKKIEQEQKSLYKSISKSIYVDTYYLLFVIIYYLLNVMSCRFPQIFLPYIIKSWWYCRWKLFKCEKRCYLMKDDYPWQKPNPRCF